MSITYALLFQPNVMKPLPLLPITKSTILDTVMEISEREPRDIPPPLPPKSPRHLPVRSATTSPQSGRLEAPTFQRSTTAPEQVHTSNRRSIPYPDSPLEHEFLTFTFCLAPDPLRVSKGPTQNPPPPPYSVVSCFKPWFPTPPRRSYADNNIYTSPHGSDEGHELERLPSIETRLEAWVVANKHHDESMHMAKDISPYELHCSNCRYGVEYTEVKRDHYDDIELQATIEMHARDSPLDEDKVAIPAQKTIEMKERRSIWDKPSFRGFLSKVGTSTNVG